MSGLRRTKLRSTVGLRLGDVAARVSKPTYDLVRTLAFLTPPSLKKIGSQEYGFFACHGFARGWEEEGGCPRYCRAFFLAPPSAWAMAMGSELGGAKFGVQHKGRVLQVEPLTVVKPWPPRGNQQAEPAVCRSMASKARNTQPSRLHSG